MNRRTQGLQIAMLAAVCLSLAQTGNYRLYVNTWMRWPLLATGLLLLALGLYLVWTGARAAGQGVPLITSAWLIAIPVVVLFAVDPPALGAYAADRARAGATTRLDEGVDAAGGTIAMTVSEFQSRGEWDDTLSGLQVELTGFATRDETGWYLNRLAISCCAADAVVYRVKVTGAEPPAVDSWVTVTGSWVQPEAEEVPRPGPVLISAAAVTETETPTTPYE